MENVKENGGNVNKFPPKTAANDIKSRKVVQISDLKQANDYFYMALQFLIELLFNKIQYILLILSIKTKISTTFIINFYKNNYLFVKNNKN